MKFYWHVEEGTKSEKNLRTKPKKRVLQLLTGLDWGVSADVKLHFDGTDSFVKNGTTNVKVLAGPNYSYNLKSGYDFLVVNILGEKASIKEDDKKEMEVLNRINNSGDAMKATSVLETIENLTKNADPDEQIKYKVIDLVYISAEYIKKNYPDISRPNLSKVLGDFYKAGKDLTSEGIKSLMVNR